MRIGFIIPRDLHNINPFKGQPLNALYLSTIVANHFQDRVTVELIDLRGIKKEFIDYYLPEKDIYFYSVTSLEFIEIKRTVAFLRELYPKAKHIAGGIHISLFPKESSEVFDVVAQGEGEDIIIQTVNDTIANELKPFYKETRFVDLNLYPYPNRAFLPKKSIVMTGQLSGVEANLPATGLILSRGCPYKCLFCANLYRATPRCRSPELIQQEIEYLKKEYGVQALVIKDDTIISINEKDAVRTLSAIAKCKVKWRGNSRASRIKESLVKLASEAGCVELALGVESAEQKVLDISLKRLNLPEAKEFILMLKKYGIGARLNLMFGLPGESKVIAKKTIEFIEEVEPSGVLLSIFMPIPGCDMYQHPEKFGINLNPDLTFDKLFVAFNRFGDDEHIEPAFVYDKVTPYGESLSPEEIVANYMEVQTYLKSKKLVF